YSGSPLGALWPLSYGSGKRLDASSSANSLQPATRKENMEMRGIVPAIFPAPPPEPSAVQVIIVDWLYREVDGLAEIKMPVLQHIAGHRKEAEIVAHDLRVYQSLPKEK